MSTVKDPARIPFADANSPAFVVRWRGREDGPFAGDVIERKLAANEMGLLHEIQLNGQWLTVRDYLSQREAALATQRQAEEEKEKAKRQREQSVAREQEEKKNSLTLQQEKRKDEILQSLLQRQTGADPVPRSLKPPRSGLLLTLAAFGLLFPPLCIVAWIMARRDAIEMKVGRRDPHGRVLADWARAVAIMGVCVWIVIGGLWVIVHFGKL